MTKVRRRSRNPAKYRLLVDKDLRPLRPARASSAKGNGSTAVVLVLMAVGIFFAWSKGNGS